MLRTVKDQIEALALLGLTVNQAKTYVSLVQTGKATIKEISKNSAIARESIYRTLPYLEGMGIVQRNLTHPTTFEAIPPRDAVSILLGVRAEKTKDLKKMTFALVEKLEKTKLMKKFAEGKDGEDKPNLTLISGQGSVIRNLAGVLNNATKSFDGITTPQSFRLGMRILAKDFEQALERGVIFRHIVLKSHPDLLDLGDKFLRKNSSWQVRFARESCPEPLTIIDQHEIFVDVDNLVPDQYSGYLRSSSPSLLAIAQYYFDSHWSQAKT